MFYDPRKVLPRPGVRVDVEIGDGQCGVAFYRDVYLKVFLKGKRKRWVQWVYDTKRGPRNLESSPLSWSFSDSH